MSDLRFGWDGRLNPSEASTDAGVIRLKSLFAEPDTMTLQFNVQGSFKPEVDQDAVEEKFEKMFRVLTLALGTGALAKQVL